MNLRSPFKINSCYNSNYSVLNCSNLVTICSIPNICGDTSQPIRSIINTETAVLKTKYLHTIDTSSDNLVTIFTRFILNDVNSQPDSIKSFSSLSASTVNVISVQSKTWRPKQKNNYKPMLCTDVDEDLYVYKHCGKSMTISPSWTPIPRSDIIPWCPDLYQKNFDENFNITSTVSDSTR